jgi:hypothetical protein
MAQYRTEINEHGIATSGTAPLQGETPPTTVAVSDRREFPVHRGEPLAWDVGLYNTLAEERLDFPKMRAVIRAMQEHRPRQLDHEWRVIRRASFSRMFGMNASVVLDVIESEIGSRRGID